VRLDARHVEHLLNRSGDPKFQARRIRLIDDAQQRLEDARIDDRDRAQIDQDSGRPAVERSVEGALDLAGESEGQRAGNSDPDAGVRRGGNREVIAVTSGSGAV